MKKNINIWVLPFIIYIALIVVELLQPSWVVDFLGKDLANRLFQSLVPICPIMLTFVLERFIEKYLAKKNHTEKITKIEVLVTAELKNVAHGLFFSKKLMDEAIVTAKANGSLPPHPDFTQDMPRSMPFTDSLGSEILLLNKGQIDALIALRASLALTSQEMIKISSAGLFSGITATSLRRHIQHNMKILASAFDVFDPGYQIRLSDTSELEPITACLRRLAEEQDSMSSKAVKNAEYGLDITNNKIFDRDDFLQKMCFHI